MFCFQPSKGRLWLACVDRALTKCSTGVPGWLTRPCNHQQGKSLTDPGVVIEFNTPSYMNDNLLLKYIQLYLIPALGNQPSLCIMVLCFSHKTLDVFQAPCQHKKVPTLILVGCTCLVQPLDVSINKSLKVPIRDLTDEAIFLIAKVLKILRNDLLEKDRFSLSGVLVMCGINFVLRSKTSLKNCFGK